MRLKTLAFHCDVLRTALGFTEVDEGEAEGEAGEEEEGGWSRGWSSAARGEGRKPD